MEKSPQKCPECSRTVTLWRGCTTPLTCCTSYTIGPIGQRFAVPRNPPVPISKRRVWFLGSEQSRAAREGHESDPELRRNQCQSPFECRENAKVTPKA